MTAALVVIKCYHRAPSLWKESQIYLRVTVLQINNKSEICIFLATAGSAGRRETRARDTHSTIHETMRGQIKVLLLLSAFAAVLVAGDDGGDAQAPQAPQAQQALPQEAFNKPSSKRRRGGGGGGGGDGGPSVKWQAGDNSGLHASAPRSQKYWDKHGLGGENRPDYAKTDAEVWAERWGGSGESSWLRLARTAVTVLLGCGFILSAFSSLSSARTHYSMASGSGKVTGGAPASAEQQRAARLARFGGESSSVAAQGDGSGGGSNGGDGSSGSSSSGRTAYQRAMAEAMGKDVD